MTRHHAPVGPGATATGVTLFKRVFGADAFDENPLNPLRLALPRGGEPLEAKSPDRLPATHADFLWTGERVRTVAGPQLFGKFRCTRMTRLWSWIRNDIPRSRGRYMCRAADRTRCRIGRQMFVSCARACTTRRLLEYMGSVGVTSVSSWIVQRRRIRRRGRGRIPVVFCEAASAMTITRFDSGRFPEREPVGATGSRPQRVPAELGKSCTGCRVLQIHAGKDPWAGRRPNCCARKCVAVTTNRRYT